MTDSADQRQLGARIGALIVDDGFGADRAVAIDDPLLCVGFHAVERDGDLAWRWTAGRARLPASLWHDLEGDFFLRIHLASPMLPQWVAPGRFERRRGSTFRPECLTCNPQAQSVELQSASAEIIGLRSPRPSRLSSTR